MMKNFSLYYEQNNEAATWKTSDVIKLRDTLRSRGHNVTQIYHDPEGNTIDLEIENPYPLSKSNNTDKYLKVSHTVSEKIMKIFFSFYPFRNRELMQNMNFSFTTKYKSVEDGINEIIDNFEYVIKNLEKLIIEKYPESIKGIEEPSLWAQKYVIDKFGPPAFLWINNPDPDIEKKYKYMKVMNRAGIFESISKSKDLTSNEDEIEDMIEGMGHRVKGVSHFYPSESTNLLFEIEAKNPILNGIVDFTITVKPDEVLIKFDSRNFYGYSGTPLKGTQLDPIYFQHKFDIEDELNQRMEKIKSMIFYLTTSAEKHVMEEDPSNIKHLDNPSRWAQDLAIEKIGPGIVTQIKNIDPELKEKYKYIIGLSRAGILEYYFDIVEESENDYNLPWEEKEKKLARKLKGKEWKNYDEERHKMELAEVPNFERWVDEVVYLAEFREMGYQLAMGIDRFKDLIAYPPSGEKSLVAPKLGIMADDRTWTKIGEKFQNDVKRYLLQDEDLRIVHGYMRNKGERYYRDIMFGRDRSETDIRFDISKLSEKVTERFYKLLSEYIVEHVITQEWVKDLLINDDIRYAAILPLDRKGQEKVLSINPMAARWIQNLDPELAEKYKYVKAMNKAGIF